MKGFRYRSTRAMVVMVLLSPLILTLERNAEAQSSIESVRVYVYRQSQLLGKFAEPSVYCDETQLARMDNGRFFAVLLAPGKHVFRSSNKQSGIELDTKSGKIYYLRVDMVSGAFGGPHDQLMKVDPEQGQYELKQLKPLGGDKIKDRRVVVSGEIPPLVQKEVLTNDDIVALKSAGLSDETIIAKLRSSANNFSLTTQDLIQLKKASLSDSVIQAMVESTNRK